ARKIHKVRNRSTTGSFLLPFVPISSSFPESCFPVPNVLLLSVPVHPGWPDPLTTIFQAFDIVYP
ncbi:MAG: hypothetical protein Q7J12_05015, partial [Syntrophales bacterium]|nr:hypothetical protein [Syntrophales bacterium]